MSSSKTGARLPASEFEIMCENQCHKSGRNIYNLAYDGGEIKAYSCRTQVVTEYRWTYNEARTAVRFHEL